MAGHSKWTNIKHKKAASDAKKVQIFTKLLREITVAVKSGGKDPQTNLKLKFALHRAKAGNLSKDNIEKAIKKASGEDKDKDYFELTYEGYGPCGIAIMVDCLTDSKNRTASDVRSTFGKGGGNLGETGCVSYMFEKKSIIFYKKSKYSQEELFDVALELGASDIIADSDIVEIYTPSNLYFDFLDKMKKEGFTELKSQIMNIPSNYTKLNQEQAQDVLKLIENLENLEDTKSVSHNLQVL